MSVYNTILDGALLQDVATGGSHDVDAGTYNYYGYAKAKGNWVILREKDDETQYRYAIGKEDYSTNWTNRESLTYKTSDNYSNSV